MRPRIALLNASQAAENTRRNFRRELDADLGEYHVIDGQLPPSFDFDAFVVTGSRCSVYWDEEWIRSTKQWIREALDRDVPALGICFGHQLLADVLGGQVEPMGEYEIGYRTVRRVGDPPIFDGLDDEFLVFTTHSDAVTELPPGADLTAENEYGIHGFQEGEVFGVQAHPEYDVRTAESVTKGKDLPDDRIQRVLADVTEENYRRACHAKRIFENFTRYVRERSDQSSTRSPSQFSGT